MPPKAKPAPKTVETLTHVDATRPNIPTVEQAPVARDKDIAPVAVAYERRNADLDPQLIWRGKYGSDGPEGPADDALEVRAAPLYIQEKVHPKALIDDLKRESEQRAGQGAPEQLNLFADFNGLPEGADKTEFYQHEQNWANRMILGDSLQVMAGLAEREGLRGQVQCIYIDPPYGIRFNSNFQWSTTSREVTDGKAEHITREPEQVKAFRDTWHDGIHSYLGYLRDRLIVARDLLAESGCIFVQISVENVHRVRVIMDEVFGEDNFINEIVVAKTVGQTADYLPNIADYCLWYAKRRDMLKYRSLLTIKELGKEGTSGYRFLETEPFKWRPLSAEEKNGMKPITENGRLVAIGDLSSQRQGRPSGEGSAMYFPLEVNGKTYFPTGNRGWTTHQKGMSRLVKTNRVYPSGKGGVGYVRYLDDFACVPMMNLWGDTVGQSQYGGEKIYVVQTANKVIQRCILMTTDPGDLVLDPTCGSGTTAYVAEQWGRRWITIDTSRVALALARARLMGARYPYYLLADSAEGQRKEAEIRSQPFEEKPASSYHGSIRQGFVYERVPHITLKSIANNAEIDVIWDKWQERLEPLREQLNAALGKHWQEWEIPREAGEDWPETAKKLHADWWEARIARQRKIDAAIAAKAEFEYLFDRPYEDKKTVRVAGPFTVESLSPHRMLAVDADGEVMDPAEALYEGGQDFAAMILEELKRSGVQQASNSPR